MSVVIVGGNECMQHRYTELCRDYDCKAKVYLRMSGDLRDFRTPGLLVLFIGTSSHKMIRFALSKIDLNPLWMCISDKEVLCRRKY